MPLQKPTCSTVESSPEKTFKNTRKFSLKAFDIDHTTFEQPAQERSAQRGRQQRLLRIYLIILKQQQRLAHAIISNQSSPSYFMYHTSTSVQPILLIGILENDSMTSSLLVMNSSQAQKGLYWCTTYSLNSNDIRK